MMNILRIFLLFVIVISCQNNKNDNIDFIVTNKSSFTIDSLELTNWSTKVMYTNLKISDSIKLNIDFNDVVSKGDGSYNLRYIVNGKTKIKNFGYFSNGSPTNSKYLIDILNDTLIIHEKILN